MLILEQPALYSSIQDLGRVGQAHLGISPGGANDSLAAWLGNRILGNPEAAAVLELIEPPARLLFVDGAHAVFSGADADIRCNGRPVPPYARCWIPAGGHIEIDRPKAGSTIYLAVEGGFETPVVLGSRSTDTRLGMSPLSRDTFLPVAVREQPPLSGHLIIPASYPNGFRLCQLFSPELEVLPGPHFDWLDEDTQRRLGDRGFTVSSQSSRMGIRLQGEPLVAPDRQCLSAGVCRGAVQLPPQGLPILLAAEHQTTGGYPLVLQVCAHHLSRMAQLRAGERIRFRILTEAEAVDRLEQWQAMFQRVLNRLSP
ncbi:MAG TPA: biotin-dependent carboxyltransferase family protein [Fluviicoccus sp.]|nr:biotin-dependent carboxyltransferase family protein [Fluviicoccus sp.]